MLKDTVDGEFTTVEDVAEAAVFFAGFSSNALTGQSLIVSHGWSMQKNRPFGGARPHIHNLSAAPRKREG